MLSRLGRFTVRRRRWVLVGTLIGVLVAGALGGGVFNRLSGGGFGDPGAESTRAEEVLEEVFGTGDPNLLLLVTADEGTVDDPAVVAVGLALTEQLSAEPGIEQAFSYWTLGSAPRSGAATRARRSCSRGSAGTKTRSTRSSRSSPRGTRATRAS